MPRDVDLNGKSYEAVIPYGEDGIAGMVREAGATGTLLADHQRLYVMPDEVIEELLNTLRHMTALLENMAD